MSDGSPLFALWRALSEEWETHMSFADRVRVAIAFGFPMGALMHVGWVIYHRDLLYHGPAPEWAVGFWYALCVGDVVVCFVMLRTVRFGLALAVATMATTMAVNWTQFPTFEYGFNLVLVGLTAFAGLVFALSPWLWRASNWRWRTTLERDLDV